MNREKAQNLTYLIFKEIDRERGSLEGHRERERDRQREIVSRVIEREKKRHKEGDIIERDREREKVRYRWRYY